MKNSLSKGNIVSHGPISYIVLWKGDEGVVLVPIGEPVPVKNSDLKYFKMHKELNEKFCTAEKIQ